MSLRVGEASRGQRSLGNCPTLSSTLEAESGFSKTSPLLSPDGRTNIALHPRRVPSAPECPLLISGPQRPSANAPASRATGPSQDGQVPAGDSGRLCPERHIRAILGGSAPRPGAHIFRRRSSQQQVQRSVAATDTPRKRPLRRSTRFSLPSRSPSTLRRFYSFYEEKRELGPFD